MDQVVKICGVFDCSPSRNHATVPVAASNIPHMAASGPCCREVGIAEGNRRKAMSSRNESPCFAASGGKIPLGIQLLEADFPDPVPSSRLLLHLRSGHEVNSTIQHQDDTSVIVHSQVKMQVSGPSTLYICTMQLTNSDCHHPTSMYSSQSCPPPRTVFLVRRYPT